MERKKRQASVRDVKYWLSAEWIAVPCILFPVILSGQNLRNTVLSVLTGIVLWCALTGCTGGWLRPGRGLSGVFEERFGRKAAAAACFFGFCFFIFQTAVFERLWAALVQEALALLSGIPEAVLCAAPAIAGALLSGAGLRAGKTLSGADGSGAEPAAHPGRGRRAGAALLFLTALLAFLAAGGVQTGAYSAAGAADRVAEGLLGLSREADDFVRGGLETAACICGMLLIFLPGAAAGSPGDQKSRAQASFVRQICLAGCACAAVGGALSIASCLFIGTKDQWRFDFPAVEALRRLRIFGTDPGRLETVLALLLAAGLTAAAAGGIRCLRRSYEYLYDAGVSLYRSRWTGRLPDIGWSGRFSWKRVGWLAVLLTAWALAAGFRDAFAAIVFYRAYNVQLLVPAALCAYLAASAAGPRRYGD